MAELILIEPDGSHQIVAQDLHFPNGMVLANDGATLVVGETFGHCLTAFERDANGDPTLRRTRAELGDRAPPIWHATAALPSLTFTRSVISPPSTTRPPRQSLNSLIAASSLA